MSTTEPSTPETDAEIARTGYVTSTAGPLVTAAFARSLERRLISLSGIWKAHREMAAKEIAELKGRKEKEVND